MRFKLKDVSSYRNESKLTSIYKKINYVSTENMLSDKRGVDKFIENINVKKARSYEKNDILLSNIRPYFKKIWFATCSGLCSNDVLVIKNKNIVNSKYLYYYLTQNTFFDYAMLTSKGTKMPRGDKNSIMKFEIHLPSLVEQAKIVKILTILDKKIETNNKINDNLENEAFELYKEYVNKTQKCSNIKILEDYCDIFTGKKNSNCAVKNGKYKFFTCAPNSQLIDSYIYDGNAIIISGNGAYTGRTRFYNGKFDLYQRTYACVIKNGKFEDYVYPLYWFVKFELSKSIMGGTRGSAIPYIVMNDISKFEFKFDERLFLSYLPMFKQCLLKIMDIEKEKDILVELRETLLPKLMSGKIDVSNIDI